MIIEPRCSKRNCKHFQGVRQSDSTELTEVIVCKAFPNGIPAEIGYGENLHSEIYPGQTGVYVFEERIV